MREDGSLKIWGANNSVIVVDHGVEHELGPEGLPGLTININGNNNVVRIEMPSLRERKDDIPLLMYSFLKEFNIENEKNIKGFDNRSKSAMIKYPWPGNIRELRNCIESAVVMCNGDEIKIDDLPASVREHGEAKSITIPIGITMDEAEKIIIQENLAANNGNKTQTADILGIGRKTLHRKIAEWESEE